MEGRREEGMEEGRKGWRKEGMEEGRKGSTVGISYL